MNNNMEGFGKYVPALAVLMAVNGFSAGAGAKRSKKKPAVSSTKQPASVEDGDDDVVDDEELNELEGKVGRGKGLHTVENPFDDQNVHQVLLKCEEVRKGLVGSAAGIATELGCDSYKYLDEVKSSKEKTGESDDGRLTSVCGREIQVTSEAVRGCLGREVSALAKCAYGKALSALYKKDEADLGEGDEDSKDDSRGGSGGEDTEDGKLKGDFAKLDKCGSDVLTLEKDIVRLRKARKNVLRGIVQLREGADSEFYGKREARKAKERAAIQRTMDILRRHKKESR